MQTSFPDRAEIGTSVKEFRATLLRSDNKLLFKWSLTFVMSLRAEFGCIYVSCRVSCSSLKCWEKKPLWMRGMQSRFLLRCKTHFIFHSRFYRRKEREKNVCSNRLKVRGGRCRAERLAFSGIFSLLIREAALMRFIDSLMRRTACPPAEPVCAVALSPSPLLSRILLFFSHVLPLGPAPVLRGSPVYTGPSQRAVWPFFTLRQSRL